MSVTTTGAGAAAAWNSSRWAFGTVAPAAAAMTCVDHPNHAGPGTFTETMTITAPAAAGTYNLYLYAYNGDACASGQSALFTRANALDNVAPTVTINQAVGQVDPTNGATINFTVVFSEPVVGFATGDVTLSGTAGATTGTVTGGPTTYNVAVTGMTGSGTVIATIGAGVATDPAGNPNAASTSADNTVTRDVTAPTVTINQAVGQPDPTNTSPILFTVVFSEPVTGFITGDVTVGGTSGGAKTGTVSGGPTTYTVSVTGMTTSGTVVATIAANRATDLVGNANTASTSTDNTVTWDVTGPTVTINQAVGQPDPANTSPILFTVVFNEPAVGFATGDVTIGGTSGGVKIGTVSGGPTTFTVSVTGMTTPGTVTATIAAGVATDGVGNLNSASTSADNTVTWDNVAPTVTINQAVGQVDPTNGATINFTVVFSEPVVGFATGDVTLSGTAGATTGTVTGGPTTYNVAVTGMTGSGTVIATIGAGVATDPAGNPNAASTSADNTVTRDVTAPTVTINQAVGQPDPTNTSPILFTVVFSEPVTGFITGDVTVGGTSGGAKTGTVSGGPTTYTVSVTGMTTSGTVVATIAANRATDLVGNANTASTSTDNTVTWDVTGPTVTINQAVGQPDPANTSPILFTVVFNEPAVGFATGDVTIGGTSGGVKIGTVSGGPTTFTVSVTGMTTPGTVTATIAAGVATDGVGNLNSASTSADNTVTWDNVAPTVTINQAVGQVDPTNGATINFTVVFSEPVVGFATGDVTLSGTAGATTGTVTGGPTTYNVAVTGMTGSGTVIATIGAGVATDPAGNPNAASTSADNTVTRDVTAPVATIDLQAGSDTGVSNSDDITNAASLIFNVTFSESVAGLAANDFSNVGTAIGCTVVAPVGAGAAYTVTLNGCGQGTVILQLRVSAVTDAVGNPNAVTDGPTVTIDRTAPTVTINQAVGQADPTNASPINFTAAFSEPVAGFTTGDVALSGTAGATTGTVSGGPATYNVAVTGMTISGTVIANIAAAVATDIAGNANTAATFADHTVTWDNVAPTVTINQAVGQVDPTNTSPITFTVVFSEPVVGFVTGDVTVGGTSGGAKTGTVSGGPTTYAVTVTGMTTPGTVIASLAAGVATDAAGNGNIASTSADNTVSWDATPPTVTIDQAVGQADPTNASPILFTVVFGEPVVGFATGDVTFGGTAGGAKVGTVSGGPTTYTVSVTGMTTSGTVIASIGAGVATDPTGNPNVASTSTDNTVTWNRATHLAFQQQPTDTSYGSTITPAVTVRILDASGLVVTESSASVTLVLAPAGPTLGGTLTVAAVNGVATFSGLSVDQIGTYTLNASSVGLTGATSASFKILPAALTITATDRTKTYGAVVTFAGTEFSVSGLLNADTVTSVTLTSPGAPAAPPWPAAPIRSPPRRRSGPACPTTRSPTSPAP